MSSHTLKMVKNIGWKSFKDNPERFRAHARTIAPWYLHNRIRSLVLPYEQQVWGKQDGRSQNPRFITIKPTFRCNLRCSFCRYVANGQVFGKADYFREDEWIKLVDEVAPYKPYFAITGGEPLMFPGIGALLKRMQHHKLHVAMVTNGTLLERKAEELMESPPASLQVSIDGPKDVHDKMRMVDGTFDKAFRGLKKLRDLKQELHSNKPAIAINSVITGDNYRNMPRMVEVAAELGADVLQFQHFWFMTPGMVDSHNHQWGDCMPIDPEEMGTTDTHGVDAEELFSIMQQVERDAPLPVVFYPELNREEVDIYYNAPETLIRPRTPGCAWLQTAIFPNGDVSPCFNHVMGNIRDTPFMEIWNNQKFREHRMRLAEHGALPICARCCAYHRYD